MGWLTERGRGGGKPGCVLADPCKAWVPPPSVTLMLRDMETKRQREILADITPYLAYNCEDLG
jgi:hypothetical protein